MYADVTIIIIHDGIFWPYLEIFFIVLKSQNFKDSCSLEQYSKSVPTIFMKFYCNLSSWDVANTY